MEPPETLSSEIEGVNGEEDQLEVQTNIISSDSGTRMSCKEKAKSMNSDKLQVPSTVTPDSCAFGEASTEVGQTISKATSHVLAALSTRDIEGEKEYQLELDESSGPIELLTLSEKRLLRERPVEPSAKGMEWQLQSTSRGRGNRGRENRGRLR
ncbi:BnaC03g30860D [Brassica napus]|uniref:BnaC03g30860D protein n=1 Tax=Brassica napus TaxID=3708 RepID=A0A078FY19_BRANA|nr:BnaC03g30860D [Brassica napus]